MFVEHNIACFRSTQVYVTMIQRKKRNSTDPSNLPRGLPRAAVQFAASGDTNRYKYSDSFVVL